LPVIFSASAMCASTFSTDFMSISRPITAPGWNPSATFIAPAVSARRYNRDHSDPGCDSLF
jgi:hypothetical protein